METQVIRCAGSCDVGLAPKCCTKERIGQAPEVCPAPLFPVGLSLPVPVIGILSWQNGVIILFSSDVHRMTQVNIEISLQQPI